MSFIQKVKVLSPGMFTTIQDEGRLGYRRFGMPQGGGVDFYAMEMANYLVGNEKGTALLEMTIVGAKLFFDADTYIAITGADMQAQLNNRQIPLYKTVKVKAGDELRFGKLKSGCRTYLSVAGGFIGDSFLGSKATYTLAGMGGIQGRALKKGDILFYTVDFKKREEREIPEYLHPHYGQKRRLRIIKGPEWKEIGLSKNVINEKVFRISAQSDRMGIRLEGQVIANYKAESIISSPLGSGSVQLLPNAELIITLSDGQTIGGYPRIGSIITADIPYLAQLAPGNEVQFLLISLEEARFLYFHNKEKNIYIQSVC